MFVTLGHFVKIKVASKMADSRCILEKGYFPELYYFLHFLKAQTFTCQKKMVDINTHLSLFKFDQKR